MRTLTILATWLPLLTAKGIHRERREAVPLFHGFVDTLASPFINLSDGFLNFVGIKGASSGSLDQEILEPIGHYGPPPIRPSYLPQVPTYHAGDPSYHAPAPSYHAPAYHPVPAPAYHPPPPTSYHKPEIHVLPSPDLSAGPSYEEPPVYSPHTYDPAPIDFPISSVVTHSHSTFVSEPSFPSSFVPGFSDVVVVKQAVNPRRPKAFNGTGLANQVAGAGVSGKQRPGSLVIDLTAGGEVEQLEQVVKQLEKVVEQGVELPATPPAFDSGSVPVSRAPVLVQFRPIPAASPGDTFFRTGEPVAVGPEFAQLRFEPQSTVPPPVLDPVTVAAVIPQFVPVTDSVTDNLEETTFNAFTAPPQAAITPIGILKDVGTTAAPPAVFTAFTDSAEVIDLRFNQGDIYDDDLTGLDYEVLEVGGNSATSLPLVKEGVAVTEAAQDHFPSLPTCSSDLTIVPCVKRFSAGQSVRDITGPTTKVPELRKVFFQIIDSTTQAEELASQLVSVEGLGSTAPTDTGIPDTIGTDPAFQEIVAGSPPGTQRKRGFRAYDPRHTQVYAHKYNDANSNWYYFRRGY